MPIFTVSIRKHLTANDQMAWSNVYHVEAATILDTVPLAATLVDMEQQIHSNLVTLHSYRVADENGPLAPVIRPINALGSYVTSGDAMPTFLACRVDFQAVQGRPGRKFYHLMLGESSQLNGLWMPEDVNLLQDVFDGIRTDFSAWLTNPTGAYFYVAATVERQITQHQFKRKWARRGVPA